MKAQKKSFRKEIRQPDEFETFWGKTLVTVMEKKREFLLGLSGLVLILVIIFAARSHFQGREEQASELLSQAQALLSSSPSADRQGRGSGTQPPGPSPEDKEDARVILEELIHDFGRTHAGQLGRLLVGDIYYEEGIYENAADTYKDFLDGRKEPAALKAFALEGLAYSHEGRGDYREALQAYEELLKSEQRYVQGWAWMGIARCHEMLEQPEKALEAYRKLLADHPYHPKAEEVKASVSRLSPGTDPETTSTADHPEGDEKDGT